MNRCLLTLCFALGLSVLASAQNTAELRRRMEERLPVLNELKASGALGENNRGYVEERARAANVAGVVEAENRDRQQVYTEIARQTGAPVDAVGRARARQIVTHAAAGTWVQDDRGQWRKK